MPAEIPLGAAPGGWPDPAALLPHGAAARHVDRILGFVPGRRVRAEWRAPGAGALFDPSRAGVPAWAGIEVMAQCAGLYLGLSRRDAGGAGKPATGFLVGVRRFRAYRETYPAGAEMTVEADCEDAHVEAGELGLFECRILCGGMVYADARLMLWSGGVETGEA